MGSGDGNVHDGSPAVQERGVIPWIDAARTRQLVLCLTYIGVSGVLIRFNKYLMHEGRFPHAMVLTSLHMSMSFLCCLVFSFLSPSSFPGLEKTRGNEKAVLKWFVPISVAFAVSLFSSNQAYIYCNVTFLQFMKEANVIIIFLMACAIGLEVMNRLRWAIILWIIAGSYMAVSGEMSFAWIGFSYQLVSQVAECSRAVMGQVVMTGELKLDPLSYTLFVAPSCLLVLLVGCFFSWDPNTWRDLTTWWYVLIPNALVAFVLNLLVATIIKEVSAIGFILSGVCKDICIVTFSAMFFGEHVTERQAFAFVFTLAGVFLWSYMKSNPNSRAEKLAASLLLMPQDKAPNERTPLRFVASQAQQLGDAGGRQAPEDAKEV